MKNRKIKIELLDPCGVVIESSDSIDYYNMGYKSDAKKPEEYPIVNGLQTVPMRTVRYKLTVGDFQYLIDRNGKILEIFNNTTEEEFLLPKNSDFVNEIRASFSEAVVKDDNELTIGNRVFMHGGLYNVIFVIKSFTEDGKVVIYEEPISNNDVDDKADPTYFNCYGNTKFIDTTIVSETDIISVDEAYNRFLDLYKTNGTEITLPPDDSLNEDGELLTKEQFVDAVINTDLYLKIFNHE